MIELLQFVFRGLWTFIGFWILLYACLAVVTRFYRMVMVLWRGWPPPHLDADGDWKPK